MKVLKAILFVFVGLIALVVIVGFLMPGRMTAEQSITINAKADVVFAHVNNLRNWNLWARWNQIDPYMEINYGDITKGQNAKYDWSSEVYEVGSGTMQITNSKVNEAIDIRLDFTDWGGSNAKMKFTDNGESVDISWSFKSDDAGMNIFARFANGFFSGALNADLIESLENLKSLSEGQTMAMDIEIMPEMNVAYVPVETTGDQITAMLAQSYGAIMTHIATQGAESTMMPMAQYISMDEEKLVFEPSIAINKEIEASDQVMFKKVPAQRMAVFYHYGNYTELSKGHDAAEAFLKKLGVEAGVESIEIYETDPGLEPDPNKWLTKICFRIED